MDATCKSEDNIKIGCDARNCMDLAQDRGKWRPYVRAVMNLRIPYKPISLVMNAGRRIAENIYFYFIFQGKVRI